MSPRDRRRRQHTFQNRVKLPSSDKSGGREAAGNFEVYVLEVKGERYIGTFCVTLYCSEDEGANLAL